MAGSSVVINIRGDGESAARALEMVQEKLRETRERAESEGGLISHAMERIGETFSALALYEVAMEALRGLKELTIGSFELGEELSKASQKTGLAVETLSVLRYAANVTGTDFEGLTGAVTKLDSTIAAATEGNKKAAGFLKGLGLDAKSLAGDSDGAEKAFKALGQQIAATENPIRRVELARGLLGKQGAEMIPMLIDVGNHWDEFVEKAKKAGVFLNGEQARSLAETNERLHEMQQGAVGAGVAFAEGLTPGVEGLIDVLSSGSGTLELFKEWGETASRGVIFLTEAIALLRKEMRDSGAEVQSTQAHFDGFFDNLDSKYGFTESQRSTAAKKYKKDVDDSNAAVLELKRSQSDFNSTSDALNAQLDKLNNPDSTGSSGKTGRRSGGFEGTGGPTVKPGKSDDAIARAAVGLAEEQARAAADTQKQVTQAMLAELETQHKLLLVSDTEYYQEKLRLEALALEAEKGALEKQSVQLQELAKKQAADKLLKRDSKGNSAEELRTQRELLQIQEKLGEVNARSQVLGSQHNAEVYAAAQAKELATLRTAADLERERDSGLASRIALIERENQLEQAKVRNAGGGDAEVDQVRQLGQVAVLKLQITELDKQIRDSEQENRRSVEELNDAAAKDPRLKQQVARQVSQLNQQEARDLAVLVQQYDALAASLGGDYIEKARDLHAELEKLNRPDNREDAQFTKTLVEGLEGLSNKMVETAGKGRNAFHEMALSIEKDMIALALKLAEEKFVTPLLTGVLGGVGGRTPALPQIGALPSALPQVQSAGAGALSTIAQAAGISGGATGAPKVVLNITNATSSPVAASQTSSSFDSDAKEFVIHAVLENAGSGGLLSHLFSGGG